MTNVIQCKTRFSFFLRFRERNISNSIREIHHEKLTNFSYNCEHTTLLGCETCSTESTAAALQKRRRFSNPTMNPIKHNKNSRENLERIALNCCVFWLFKTLICWSDEFSELFDKPRFLLSTISIIKKPYCKRAGTDERSKRRKKQQFA